MKVFIVFLSLILVFTFLCTTTNDISKIKQINVVLKTLAEEIACGGGLMTGSSFKTDNISINLDDAKAYADFVLKKASNMPLFRNGTLSYNLSLDNGGMSITAVVFFQASKSPITHTFSADSSSFKRSSIYEWGDIKGK